LGNLLMFMLGFILLGSTVLLPLFVQTMLGYTATDAGLVISPGGFAIMLLMPLVGALVSRVDARILIAFGLTASSLALFDMTRFDLNVDYGTVAWARIYQSASLAFLFIPINTIAFFGLPPAKSNESSAIINMMRNLGGSFGIAIATTLLVRRQQYHQNVLVAHVTPYHSAYNATIETMQRAFASQSASAADALHHAQALLYAMVQKQAAMLSYIDGFWVMAVISLAMVPFVLLLRKAKPSAAGPPAH
jgi:DHA2 family multidrug resistance protein